MKLIKCTVFKKSDGAMDRTALQKVMESLGDEEFSNTTISISFLVICPVQKNFFKPTEGL